MTRFFLFSSCCAVSLMAAFSLSADTIVVNISTDIDQDSSMYGGLYNPPTMVDLRGALNQTNVAPVAGGYMITFDPSIAGSTITLTSMLPILNLLNSDSTQPLIIDGETNSITIDGGGAYRGFFANQGKVMIRNLAIQNVKAVGGNGGYNGGGGGMGAGAGLFVRNADVTLLNTTISTAVSTGGNGNTTPMVGIGYGGGGGLGGNGGNGNTNAVGGGGGLGGAGGAGDNTAKSGGGGGGINCGGTNHSGAANGGQGGGSPGASAGDGQVGTSGGAYGGGGGEGGFISVVSGGGGGGGGIGGVPGDNGGGGNGGFGGGGGGSQGGSQANFGGTGGYGGGGGGAAGAGSSNFGGGGGAGGDFGFPGDGGGAGGFGGGGGADITSGTKAGLGGIGGGSGNNAGFGGGGAGFGGGIFVDAGGTLTLANSYSSSLCTVGGGGGANAGWAGGGAAFFLTGASVIFDPDGDTITISNSIADDGPATFQGFGGTVPSPPRAGVNIVIGNPLSAPGTVILTGGASTYFGGTTLNQGILEIGQDGDLGASQGGVTFNNNTTLRVNNGAGFNVARTFTFSTGANGTIETVPSGSEIAGVMTGAGTFTKTGAGNLILSNASNNHTGSTNIQQGTLRLLGSGTIASSQAVNLSAGATLDLTFASDPVTVRNVSGAAGATIDIGTTNLTCDISNPGTTIASTISDSGGEFIKTGSGPLTLEGSKPYTSATSVLQGSLVVNGQIISPVTVFGGGKLQGIGTVQNSVMINGGGSIQAGNSIGDFSMDSLTLADSSSILELDIDLTAGSNLSSRYLVTNAVLLNGGALQLNFVTPTGTPTDHSYEFIIFNGGDPGVFGSVTSIPGYTSEVIISPNLITLKLTPAVIPPPPPPTPSNTIGAGVSVSPNQEAVLSYLLAFLTVPALHDVFLDLAALSPDGLRAALDSISPARDGAATFFTNQVAFDFGRIGLMRVRDGRILGKMRRDNTLAAALAMKSDTFLAMGEEVPALQTPVDLLDTTPARAPAGSARTAAAASEKYAFWMSGFGDFLSQDGQNSNPHINDTASGAMLGFDYYGTQNGIFTVSAGYIHNDITEGHRAGSGSSNGGVVSVYGTGYVGDGYLEAGVLGGYNRFDMKRRVAFGGPVPFNATAKSDFNNWVAMPHLGGGYDCMMKWGVIEPFASLDWAVSFQEAYREKGASPLNARIKSQTPSVLRSQAGLNVYETWDNENSTFIFEQSASYVNKAFFHTKMRSAIIIAPTAIPAGAPSSFTVQTYNKMLNLGSVGLDLFYKHKRSGFFLSGNYQGEFGSSYMSNEVTGTLGVLF